MFFVYTKGQPFLKDPKVYFWIKIPNYFFIITSANLVNGYNMRDQAEQSKDAIARSILNSSSKSTSEK